jgi:hypothetical protein
MTTRRRGLAVLAAAFVLTACPQPEEPGINEGVPADDPPGVGDQEPAEEAPLPGATGDGGATPGG